MDLAEASEVCSKMDFYSSQILNLVEQLSHLPGIGNKSAQRLAFHILNMPQEQVKGLADARNAAHIRMMNFVLYVLILSAIISR